MFHFKKFSIDDSLCAMKIGVDSILLASWVNISEEKNILDIGCGCGILSLIMAQRTENSIITGVEIHTDAARQAKENVSLSPWSNRIEITKNSFQQFAKTIDWQYDLIISNPPFFHHSLKSASQARNTARHNDSLPVNEIFEGLQYIVHQNSKVNVIIPFDLLDNWTKEAFAHNFYPENVCLVKSLPQNQPHRAMICFGKLKNTSSISELCIYDSPNQYSKAYKELTSDFYLHF